MIPLPHTQKSNIGTFIFIGTTPWSMFYIGRVFCIHITQRCGAMWCFYFFLSHAHCNFALTFSFYMMSLLDITINALTLVPKNLKISPFNFSLKKKFSFFLKKKF
uniref:Uncharacterized protein n=1 Tax=Cacopsylla melanoneura TaxID=428564 RepID=A0A8D9ELH1_9HEMI